MTDTSSPPAPSAKVSWWKRPFLWLASFFKSKAPKVEADLEAEAEKVGTRVKARVGAAKPVAVALGVLATLALVLFAAAGGFVLGHTRGAAPVAGLRKSAAAYYVEAEQAKAKESAAEAHANAVEAELDAMKDAALPATEAFTGPQTKTAKAAGKAVAASRARPKAWYNVPMLGIPTPF